MPSPDKALRMVLGGVLVALPFMGITALMLREGTWKDALIIWGIDLAIVALIAAGVYLLTGEAK